jgi:hypothetical protein
MATNRSGRWLLISVAIIATLLVAIVVAFHFAARTLKGDVLRALGPESEIGDLRVGFTSIIISNVNVGAPRGWPAKSTLSAERVVVQPNLRQLLSRRIEINKVTVENGYVSVVRPKEGGGLKILPTMLAEHKKQKAQNEGKTGHIETVELDNCVVEFFDATVTAGKGKMRLDTVHGTIDDINIPKLDSRSKVDLQALIKGHAHNGTMAVAGWVNVEGKSSELATRVRGVDLVLFQPYLIQKAKAGIDEGTFNLELKAAVKRNVVGAQGELLLADVKLQEGDGTVSTLATILEKAVLSTLADKEGNVTLDFELTGNLDNPNFSLSKGLGLRTGVAALKTLGLGFEALVRAFLALVTGLGPALAPA